MTTTDDLRLFDLEPYGGADPTPFELRSAQREKPEPPPVEALAPGYRYIRNRSGVFPHAHLIASRASSGAVATLCGKIGTQLSNWGITQMTRCPECDLAQQLDFGA